MQASRVVPDVPTETPRGAGTAEAAVAGARSDFGPRQAATAETRFVLEKPRYRGQSRTDAAPAVGEKLGGAVGCGAVCGRWGDTYATVRCKPNSPRMPVRLCSESSEAFSARAHVVRGHVARSACKTNH